MCGLDPAATEYITGLATTGCEGDPQAAWEGVFASLVSEDGSAVSRVLLPFNQWFSTLDLLESSGNSKPALAKLPSELAGLGAVWGQ